MQIARYLPPLLLLPLGAAAWAQTTGAPMIDPAGAAGAAAILATMGPLSWRLLGIVESLVREKVGSKPAVTSMSVGTLLDDRQAVLDAARQTNEMWKTTAAPDGNGQPRLLAHQAEVARQMRDLVTQVEATSAAQAASTASTAALVAVLRDLLAMSPAAEAARSRARGDR